MIEHQAIEDRNRKIRREGDNIFSYLQKLAKYVKDWSPNDEFSGYLVDGHSKRFPVKGVNVEDYWQNIYTNDNLVSFYEAPDVKNSKSDYADHSEVDDDLRKRIETEVLRKSFNGQNIKFDNSNRPLVKLDVGFNRWVP